MTTTPRSRLAALAAIAVTGALTLSACGGSSGGGSSEPLKLGVILPLSGPAGDLGQKAKAGVELFAAEAKDAGGIEIDGEKVPVEVHYCDSEYQSPKAVSCGQKLASQQGVSAIITATSVDTLPLMSFNERDGQEFIIATSAATDKVVDSGNSLVSRYWFATSAYMPSTGELLASANEKEDLGIDKIAVLASDDEFGTSWSDDFTENVRAAGFSDVKQASFKANTTDLYPQLTPLISSGANLLALPLTCDMAANAVKQAKELGYDGRYMFMLACDASSLADAVGGKKALAGDLFEGGPWNLGSEAEKQFQAAFEKEYGKPGDPSASTTYSQAAWLAKAAELAGSTDATKMRKELPAALEKSPNTLAMKDVQDNGEITGTVHLRLVGRDGSITEITE